MTQSVSSACSDEPHRRLQALGEVDDHVVMLGLGGHAIAASDLADLHAAIGGRVFGGELFEQQVDAVLDAAEFFFLLSLGVDRLSVGHGSLCFQLGRQLARFLELDSFFVRVFRGWGSATSSLSAKRACSSQRNSSTTASFSSAASWLRVTGSSVA